MGEEPTAEEKLTATRAEIAAQRAELERTSDQLRDALNIKKRFQENPAAFIGLGAGVLDHHVERRPDADEIVGAGSSDPALAGAAFKPITTAGPD